MVKVAIVILNYNGKDYLEKFLPNVEQFSVGHQIIVADNCSTDDSIQLLEDKFPKVTLIKFDSNAGYSGGYKLALEQIAAEYYVLLNSDIEVTENWVEPVIDLMDADKKIAACQPKILSYAERGKFEYAGAAGGFIDTLGYPFCRGRIFETLEEDNGQYDDEVEVFWATGACLFFRASAYHEAGGLDASYFAHMEEIDLCWRLKGLGYKNYYCGKSKIYHIGGGTLHKSSPRKTFLNFKNSLTTLFKNSTLTQVLWKIPARLTLDGIAGLKFLLTGEVGNFFAVIKAHFSFYGSLPSAISKRRIIQAQRKVRTYREMYAGSIVVAYFLKGIKTFRGLKF